MITICPTSLNEILIVEPSVFKDKRGFFIETYHQEKYQRAGITKVFVQNNYSHSIKGVLRGLHYQLDHPQGKLILVIRGAIFDIVVDIRYGSPTFGKWTGVYLSENNHHQLFIPEGFAHGFCVLSEQADVIYQCTDFYSPGDEYGIRWDDPEVGIDWPVQDPILSEKDAGYPFLLHQTKDRLPQWKENEKGNENKTHECI